MENCGTSRQVRGENITRRTRFGCQITKARKRINSHKMLNLVLLQVNNGEEIALQCYINTYIACVFFPYLYKFTICLAVIVQNLSHETIFAATPITSIALQYVEFYR